MCVGTAVSGALAGQLADARAHVALDLGPQRAPRGGERHGDGHVAVVDADVADHAELDDVAAELGIHDSAQNAEDVFGGGGWRSHGVILPGAAV